MNGIDEESLHAQITLRTHAAKHPRRFDWRVVVVVAVVAVGAVGLLCVAL